MLMFLRFELVFSKTSETGKDVVAPPEGFEQMQSLRFIDNNYTASDFPLQCLFSVDYASPSSKVLMHPAKYYLLPI